MSSDRAPAPHRVPILGADGFIGRHLAFALRAAGWPGFGALVAVFWLMVSKPDSVF